MMKVFDANATEYQKIPLEKLKFVERSGSILDENSEVESVGFFKDAAMRFGRNRASVVSLVIILVIVVMALFGPAMTPYGYNDQETDRINMPVKIGFLSRFNWANGSRVLVNRRVDMLDDIEKYPEGSILEVTSRYTVNGVEMCDVRVDYYKFTGQEDETFWLGSDYLGRDIWARLWRGARVSLIIAVVSVVMNVFIGTVYGAVSGYYGGRIDMVMMRITEIIGSLPQIVIITIFIMFFGTGMFSIIMALVMQDWIGTARMLRGEFYRYKGREYVLASRTLGTNDRKIIFRHILPNAIGPIITRAMMALPTAIFAESFLAYIGLGLQAPEPSIGVLLSNGQRVLLHYPNQVLFPSLLISVLMISFNLFANGLRDAFDPTQRGA